MPENKPDRTVTVTREGVPYVCSHYAAQMGKAPVWVINRHDPRTGGPTDSPLNMTVTEDFTGAVEHLNQRAAFHQDLSGRHVQLAQGAQEQAAIVGELERLLEAEG